MWRTATSVSFALVIALAACVPSSAGVGIANEPDSAPLLARLTPTQATAPQLVTANPPPTPSLAPPAPRSAPANSPDAAAPPPSEPPIAATHTAVAPASNPFSTGSPELLACMRETLGAEKFERLASLQREAAPDEIAPVLPCLRRYGPEFTAAQPTVADARTPVVTTNTIVSAQLSAPPAPATTTPVIAVEPEACPTGLNSLAELGTFDWERRPMRSGEVANFAVSPSDPNVMYVGMEVNAHSVYRSDDGGRSWRLLHEGDHAKDMAVDPHDPDVAFHADSQGVWRTTDGSHFTRVLMGPHGPGPDATSYATVAVAPSNPNIVYAAMRGGRMGPIGSGFAGELFKSSDGGASFVKVGADHPVLNVVLADPRDERRLLAGSDDGIYLSTDGGASLSKVLDARDVVSLHTADGAIVLGASAGGVLRSTDGGASWQTISEGLPSANVLRVRFVREFPSVAWATTLEGVVRSRDAGRSWQNVSGPPNGTGLPSTNLQGLAVAPDNPDTALVATDSFVFSVRSSGLFRRGQYHAQGIYRTDDGGESWSRSDDGIFAAKIDEITTNPVRPHEVWAAPQAGRGVYRSRDAGQSWSLSPTFLTHYPMRIVFFPNQPDGLAMTGLHNSEYFGITSDAGVNWTVLSEQIFFAGLNRGLELFDPSQAARGNLHVHGLAIHPDNPDVILVGTVADPSEFNAKPLKGAHIFRSLDGGATWDESDEGFDHAALTSIHDIKFDPHDPDTIWIATTEHEATNGNGLWKSEDGGVSWRRSNAGMPDRTSASVIVIHPQSTGLLVSGTLAGIYRSDDAGTSWQLADPSRTGHIELDPQRPDVLYAGTSDGVLLSVDFGLTWRDVSAGLPPGAVNAIGVSCDGTVVYAGVDGYGLFATVAASAGVIEPDPTTGVEYGAAPRRGPGATGFDGPIGGPGALEPGAASVSVRAFPGARPTGTAAPTPVQVQPGDRQGAGPAGLDPLASASPELLACLRTSMGDGGFEEFLRAQRPPTDRELSLMMPCFIQHGGFEP